MLKRVTFPELCGRSVASVGEPPPGNQRAWARRPAWLLWVITLMIAAAGLALMVWDWPTPVPRGFFGIRGFAGLYAVGSAVSTPC